MTDPSRASDRTPSPREQERQALRGRLRRRSVTIASVATALVLGGLVAGLLTSPGWPAVQTTFFSLEDARGALPSITKGFVLNVQLFLLAEPLILVVALALALASS